MPQKAAVAIEHLTHFFPSQDHSSAFTRTWEVLYWQRCYLSEEMYHQDAQWLWYSPPKLTCHMDKILHLHKCLPKGTMTLGRVSTTKDPPKAQIPDDADGKNGIPDRYSATFATVGNLMDREKTTTHKRQGKKKKGERLGCTITGSY